MSMVLGIDPGTRKAGFAVAADELQGAVALGIEPLETLPQRLAALVSAYPVGAVALGAGTNASVVRERLVPLGLPIFSIDERDTTYSARALYFADHPPRGWRRFIPVTLQLPPRPIDDYAALLIARRFLARGRAGGGVVTEKSGESVQ